MSANRGQFKKGQSGNPAGRPAINRVLADKLREYADKPGFHEITFQHMVSYQVWQAAAFGEVELASGRFMELTPKEWLTLCKWLHVHIDGSLHWRRSLVEADGSLTPDAELENPAPALEASPTAETTDTDTTGADRSS